MAEPSGATSGYDAFISYSHALDGAVAQALQTGLERFAKPWYQLRALRVFRDTTSLSANPGLWSSIETALERVWKPGLPVSGAGEAAGHGHDHGDGDHGFVVLGQGLVVARTAAVFGDPAEGPLDDPAPG